MEKTKILVIPSDNRGGIGFYRSVEPHLMLEKMFPDEFEVTFDMNPDYSDLTAFDEFNIIHIHYGVLLDTPQFEMALNYFKSHGIKTILDIDDYWILGNNHPMYNPKDTSWKNKVDKFKYFDVITTTTEFFAEKIRKYNPNVKIFHNGINPSDKRFQVIRKPSDKLRIGLIMGSTHEKDVALIGNISNMLKAQGLLDKVQLVLCGFDTRGTKRYSNQFGETRTEQMAPTEIVWYRYEQQLTDNYKIVSEQHKQFLHMFLWGSQFEGVENEPYKRCWTKNLNHYYQHYAEVDVLLVPLAENEFNLVKSPLKVAECCFSHTAMIASNFGPYTIDLKSAIGFGGVLNPDGNALLVDSGKNNKNWIKYITKLIKEPELVKQLQDNLYRDCHEKYDLRNITKDRAEFYKQILNK